MTGKPVVITTEHRGVFFGYVKDDSNLPTSVELTGVRNCISWTASVKGVLGLAATGPNADCRIGPQVPDAKLWKITGVFDCTPAAAEAWEGQPWRS